MRILYLDIDGYAVNADIQGYVRQIELFGDEPIKDCEYIKKCINFMLERAKKENASVEEINFINKVYNYVSINMFEMLKEYRDCFLEFDNLSTHEERIEYLKSYQSNPVRSSNNEEIPKYMKYIIGSLRLAKTLIESEYDRYEREGGKLNLPFKTINEENDIISYNESDNPLKRAISALKRMELYAMNSEKEQDDFLNACRMVGDTEIVKYDEIYVKENIMPGLKEGLRYMLETGKVDLIVACSHHTGHRETLAKKRLFREELPFVLLFEEAFPKFHSEPAQMGKRRLRSSKNLQIDKINRIIAQIFRCSVSNIETILGDDSRPNLEMLEDNKYGFWFRRNKENEHNPDEVIEPRFIKQYNWRIEEIDRVFDIIDKLQDTKEVTSKDIKQYVKINNGK